MGRLSIGGIVARLFSRRLSTNELTPYFESYDKGQYDEAYASLQRLLKKARWRRFGTLYVLCADLMLLKGDVAEASSFLDHARRSGHFNKAEYLRLRGYILWKGGRHNLALRYLWRSVKVEPRIENLQLLGRMLANADDPRELSIWRQLLNQDPKNAVAHVHLVHAAFADGDAGKAFALIKRTETLHARAEDLFSLGKLSQRMGQHVQALKLYFRAEQVGYREKGQLYACVANCYRALGDEQTGRSYVEWAVKFSPEDECVRRTKDAWRAK